MKFFKPFPLVFVCVLLLSPSLLNAQEDGSRWSLDGYFPKGYFSKGDFTHQEPLAGEVVYYMRLAGIKPLKDSSVDSRTTVFRLNFVPEYLHPLFVQVVATDGGATLHWQKGNAVAGYVEHTTYYEMGDSSWVDVTEKHHRGNVWEEGKMASGSRQLTYAEWQHLLRLADSADIKRRPHIDGIYNSEIPYIVEYRTAKHYNAYYSGSYHWNKDSLAHYLVALADSDYVDPFLHSRADSGATFPGGDSARALFIRENLRYPPAALRELEECSLWVDFIVEKDGTLNNIDVGAALYDEDKYGFFQEAERIVKSMPRWEPARIEGKVVRYDGRCKIQFSLPDSLKRHFGHPVIDTKRDSSRWDNIEQWYRRLTVHPDDAESLKRLGMIYYGEFILEHSPDRIPDEMDSIFHYGDDWSDFHDRTALVDNPGDSAIHYLYRTWPVADTQMMLDIYVPTLQLERWLKLPHNPIAKLPFDTVAGLHLPASYFIDPITDSIGDIETDAWSSAFWVRAFSETLNSLGEPVLFDTAVAPGDTLYRLSFYPSFHPALSFRIERRAGKSILYWGKLDYKVVDEEKLQYEITPKTGHRKMSGRQYRKFLELFGTLHFDTLPPSRHMSMLDGAQWLIERRTVDGYKAYFTNLGGDRIRVLYDHLIRTARLKAKYAAGYCH